MAVATDMKRRKLSLWQGKYDWKTIKNQRQLIFMSFPFVIYILIFAYSPIWGWLMAFQNYLPGRPLLQQQWAGFAQFKFLFMDEGFFKVFRNTIAMSMINMVLGFITAIALALLLNEIKRVFLKRSVQIVSYLPHFLSYVIVTALVMTSLSTEDGIVNIVLMKLHLISKPILWLGVGKYFWGVVGASYVWKELGWNTILYLAAIAAIDPALYEAANVDGANRWQKMLHITLPGIKATFMVLLIMAIGNAMNAGFEMQYLLGTPQVMDYSETIDIFALRYGMRIGNFSLATAAGMFKTLVNLCLLFAANATAKKLGEERLL